jgi:hypothetical protein
VKRVSRADILAAFGAGRDEKLAQRTINRHVIVGLMALRNARAVIQLKKGDWPKVPESEVEIYTQEEIKELFKACTDEERLIFKTYPSSGFRNRVVATLTKDCVTSQSSKLSVKARPQFNFNRKNYECRSEGSQRGRDRLEPRPFQR